MNKLNLEGTKAALEAFDRWYDNEGLKMINRADTTEKVNAYFSEVTDRSKAVIAAFAADTLDRNSPDTVRSIGYNLLPFLRDLCARF